MARALIHQPKLVFLDEPSAGLDPLAAVNLREDLRDLVEQQRVTVFLTTHHLAEAEQLCHRVAVMNSGRLLASGTPTQVKNQTSMSTLEEAFLTLVRSDEKQKESV